MFVWVVVDCRVLNTSSGGGEGRRSVRMEKVGLRNLSVGVNLVETAI